MISRLGDRKGRSPVVNTIDNQGNPVGAGLEPAPTSTTMGIAGLRNRGLITN